MFPHDTLSALAVLVPAFVPAIWWGVETRRLLRRPDDPLVPERLLAARRRASTVLVLSLGIVAGVKSIALWWAVPLALVARAAAGFRLRRRFYEETWSFPKMVSFSIRLLAAVYGFHLTLLALPFLVALPAGHVWITSIIAALVLLAWNQWYASVFRALLRTRPVTDPVLAGAFSDLVTRAGIERPRFEYVNMQGGSLTNAIALPALNGSSVVFTSPLLERLQTDEIVAITAHEIAHLEYYSPRRLRQYRLAQWSLILIGAFGFRFWPVTVPQWGQPFVWLALIIGALGWRARKRQQNETESDRRAVALTGTADALARALVKLNTFARLPRRWDAAFERRATHPSLARRVRDIYAAAGASPITATAFETFTDATTSTCVTFGPELVQWRRDGAEHNLRYAALIELRVLPRRGGTATLVAADRFGHRWEMPLEEGDVGRVQRVLDAVDVHVVNELAPARASGAARLTSFIAAALALATAQFGCALVALLAAAVGSLRLFAAAAAACIAAGAIAMRDGHTDRGAELLVCAAAFIVFAFFYRRTVADSLERRALATMATATLIALLLLFDNGIGAYGLHQSARALPDAAVLLLATATALRVRATFRPIRYSALLLGFAGVAIIFAGSSAFVNGFVNDPLLVRAPALSDTPIASAPLAVMAVSFEPTEVTLAPDGQRVMLWRDDEEIGDQPGNDWTLQVGRIGGTLTSVKADDAVFAPDGQLLSVSFGEQGTRVQEGLPGTEPTWRTDVDDVASGKLALASDGRHWSLVGWDRRQQPIKATGAIGTAAVDIVRWPGVPGIRYSNIASTGQTAAVLEQHYRRSRVATTLARWGLGLPYASSTRVWRLDLRGRILVADSQLQIACAAEAVPDAFVCAAYDGTRTRLATIDVASGRILPLTIVPGRFTPYAAHAVPGWLTGWRDRSAMAIRLDPVTAYELPRTPGRYARSMSGAGDRLAVIESDGDRAAVAVYSLTDIAAAAK